LLIQTNKQTNKFATSRNRIGINKVILHVRHATKNLKRQNEISGVANCEALMHSGVCIVFATNNTVLQHRRKLTLNSTGGKTLNSKIGGSIDPREPA